MLRLLRAELHKTISYRTPLLAAIGAIVLLALWAAQIAVRNAAYGEGGFLTSMLGMTGVILPVLAFLIPILLIEADTRHGSLAPILTYVPRPRAILVAKWGAAILFGCLSAVTLWACIVVPLLTFYANGNAVAEQIPLLGRMFVLVAIWVSCATAVDVLSGYKGPWVILSFLLWVYLVERLLGSALPGMIGMVAVPFRLANFWLRDEWDRVDPWGLSWAGAAPMAAYTIAIVIVTCAIFLFFSDAAGRTWGRKRARHDHV